MVEFVDPYLLTTTLIMTILLIIGNLYAIAYFSHHADNGFGSSAACKFVIVSYFIILKYLFCSWLDIY